MLALFGPWVFAGGILHAVSRNLLLWKLLWDKSCRGISLVSQELWLCVYIARYLDLLYLFESFGVELIKVLHLIVAVAIVLLMRYSPEVAATYDADDDVAPRAALLLPPLLLAVVWHKVLLIIEVLHQFSNYLEAIVLIPQFILLYRRQKYEVWVLAFTVLAGAEGVVRGMPLLLDWKEQQASNPYDLCAAVIQAAVYVGGLVALALRHVETKRHQGLNEQGNKPAFDEVWEAGKFEFQDTQQGQQQPGGGTATADAKRAQYIRPTEGP